MGWGWKLFGATLGGMLGGPIGVAIGAGLGHAIDSSGDGEAGEDTSGLPAVAVQGPADGMSPHGHGLLLHVSAPVSPTSAAGASFVAWLCSREGHLKSGLPEYADTDGDLACESPFQPGTGGVEGLLFFPEAALPPGLQGQVFVRVLLRRPQEVLAASRAPIELLPSERREIENSLSALVNAAVSVACSAGPLESPEVKHIRDHMVNLFELNDTGQEKLRQILKRAHAQPLGHEPLVALLTPRLSSEDHQGFVSFLYQVARADGSVHPSEEAFIVELCRRLKIAESVQREARQEVVVGISRFFAILELPPTASWEEVRSAYRRLARDYHPDRVQNLPKGFQEFATQKMRELNEALEAIEKHLKPR